MYLCADIDDLKRDTGFEPKVDFKTGIKNTVEWYKEQKMADLILIPVLALLFVGAKRYEMALIRII